MRKLITRSGIGLMVLLMLAFAGSRSASAQTAPPSAGIFNASGTQIGTASVLVSAGSMQITVTLKGAPSNALYAVCITDPLSFQQFSGCSGFALTGVSNCGFLLGNTFCVGTTAAVSVATDQSGSGTATFTVPGVMPSVVVVLTNALSPGDVARALVSTGAVGTSLNVGCPPGFC